MAISLGRLTQHFQTNPDVLRPAICTRSLRCSHSLRVGPLGRWAAVGRFVTHGAVCVAAGSAGSSSSTEDREIGGKGAALAVGILFGLNGILWWFNGI